MSNEQPQTLAESIRRKLAQDTEKVDSKAVKSSRATSSNDAPDKQIANDKKADLTGSKPETLAESIRRKIAELKANPNLTWPKVSDEQISESPDKLLSDDDKTLISVSDPKVCQSQMDTVDDQAKSNAAKKSGMSNSKTNIRQFVRVLASGTRLGAYEIIEEIADDDKAKTYSAKQVNFDIAVNIVVPKIATKDGILEFQSWIKQVAKGEIIDPRGAIVDTGLNGMVVYAVLRNNSKQS